MEQVQWLRRAALLTEPGQYCDPLFQLGAAMSEQLRRYEESGSGRVVLEMGAAFAAKKSWHRHVLNAYIFCNTALELYNKWRAQARTAVLCWLWLARQKGVAKDIRVLIADVIWDDRAAWSDS